MSVFIVNMGGYSMWKVRSGEEVRVLHIITAIGECPEVRQEYPFDLGGQKVRIYESDQSF